MNSRTTLYVMTTDTPDDQVRDATEAAAAAQNHLVFLILGDSPALPMSAFGMSPYGGVNVPENWTEMIEDTRKKQHDSVQKVENHLVKSNTSGDVQSVICATMEVKNCVARAARVCDEAFLAANLRDTPDILREAAAGVLFHSPIGFRFNGSPSEKPARVFVAWDSSKAASSAVHAALPHMKEAQEVVISCIDPIMSSDRDGQDPGTDVAAWLSHHGCKVTVSQIPSGGREVGQCLQDHAKEFGADLVVMGAYGHARMIQTVLGGTTRSMMEQTDLPVLFAH